jgi:hypothetical protein
MAMTEPRRTRSLKYPPVQERKHSPDFLLSIRANTPGMAPAPGIPFQPIEAGFTEEMDISSTGSTPQTMAVMRSERMSANMSLLLMRLPGRSPGAG